MSLPKIVPPFLISFISRPHLQNLGIMCYILSAVRCDTALGALIDTIPGDCRAACIFANFQTQKHFHALPFEKASATLVELPTHVWPSAVIAVESVTRTIAPELALADGSVETV